MKNVKECIPDEFGCFVTVYEDCTTVNILGTEYTIEEHKIHEDKALENCDGYCDNTVKQIIIQAQETPEPNSKKDLDSYFRKVLRHEIIHAFLSESGLQASSEWAENEEIVDWIAIQDPKIYKAWKEVDAL